jgi:NAD(P)-dependent dehydrogenase (short-subunit alcohol dehydrogenase family)
MADMNGKTCLVTGATSGIGEGTALELARMGACVVLVGRSPERCQASVARIKQATGNSCIEFQLADLSCMAQVRQAAQQFIEKHNRLDVLVNNAGAAFLSRQLSCEGLEMTFALNHLNYFLLTRLLLDTLKASAPARIVNVASDSHRGQKLDFNDLQLQNSFSVIKAYGRSKLANVLFTYELARRLDGSSVTVNALHPGTVATRIWQKGGPLNPLISVIMRGFTLPVEKGSQTPVYLASSPEVEGVTGKFFTNCKAVRSDPASYDEGSARRLWEISSKMVGLPED